MKLYSSSISGTAPLKYPVGMQIGAPLPSARLDGHQMAGTSFSSVDAGIANFHASQSSNARTPPQLLDCHVCQLVSWCQRVGDKFWNSSGFRTERWWEGWGVGVWGVLFLF